MVDSKKRPGKDLDRIDRNILNELQKDGRISNVELSKRVGLSPTPCLERCLLYTSPSPRDST
ncbi:AsnC family transcriptional regulator, partial [Escherichia coli]